MLVPPPRGGGGGGGRGGVQAVDKVLFPNFGKYNLPGGKNYPGPHQNPQKCDFGAEKTSIWLISAKE